MKDAVEDAVQIFIDVSIPESDDAPALRFQIGLAFCVCNTLVFGRMRRAVEFNDEASFIACEVCDEWPDWMLATEAIAMQALALQL